MKIQTLYTLSADPIDQHRSIDAESETHTLEGKIDTPLAQTYEDSSFSQSISPAKETKKFYVTTNEESPIAIAPAIEHWQLSLKQNHTR